MRRLASFPLAVGANRAGAPAPGGAAQGRRGRTNALAEALGKVEAPKPQEPPRRRVCFSHETPDTHDVTPYANHYGIHPSFFDFDREGDMRLTFEGLAEVFRRRQAGLAPLEDEVEEHWSPAAEF